MLCGCSFPAQIGNRVSPPRRRRRIPFHFADTLSQEDGSSLQLATAELMPKARQSKIMFSFSSFKVSERAGPI